MTKSEIIKKFSEFLKIKSVPTDKNYFSEIKKAVEFLVSWLKSLNFEVKVVEKNQSPPLVVGYVIKK